MSKSRSTSSKILVSSSLWTRTPSISLRASSRTVSKPFPSTEIPPPNSKKGFSHVSKPPSKPFPLYPAIKYLPCPHSTQYIVITPQHFNVFQHRRFFNLQLWLSQQFKSFFKFAGNFLCVDMHNIINSKEYSILSWKCSSRAF